MNGPVPKTLTAEHHHARPTLPKKADLHMKTAGSFLLSKRSVRTFSLLALGLIFALLLRSNAAIAAENSDTLTGQLLVASPEMKDPRFVETVIYMVKHSAEGAFGLVINRPVAKGPIEDLLKGFHAEAKGAKGEIIIHYGGPVTPTAGFILHTDDVLLDNSTKVKDGIAVTSDAKLIAEIGRGKGPRQALVIMGYAGWAPGQLETELKAEAWFVVPADKRLIFGKDPEKKWRQALDKRQVPL
jgi:putative transcriptional regulator